MGRGRKPLSIWEKTRKPEFEKRLAGYSLTALDNIIENADGAFDQRHRLQANMFLVDKVVGKEYTLINSEKVQEAGNVVINVVPVQTEADNISPQDIDTEITKAMEESEDNSSEWDLIEEEENWDDYDPEEEI